MTTSQPSPHKPAHIDESRRGFLAGAAALAGAALIGSRAGAAAQPGSVTPAAFTPPKAKARKAVKDGEPIRMGVIGLGGPGGCAMGLNHVISFANFNKDGQEKVEIAAICDLNKIFLEHGKQELAKIQKTPFDTYTNYKDLLAREDLHAVLLALPEHWHAQAGIDAIAAGKDVYSEKPMTLNLADALHLHQAASSNPDLIFQVGTQMVNLPKYHEAAKLIKAGAIGTPTFSQTSYCRNSKEGEWHYTIDPAWKPGENLDWDTWCGPVGPMPWDPKVYYQWRRYRKVSTGICGDLLVHVMTPMMMALDQGWPVKVAATGAHHSDKDMENFDNINIAAQFETGHQMVVAGSTCNEAGLETMIRGHKANIYLGSRHCVLRPERPFAEEIDEKTIECPDIGNDQDKHRLRWLHCIRTREATWSGTELGLKVMIVVDLATRSMWEGRAFAFDPKTMTSRAI
ncbi:MAG: hypothetical protein GC200_03365 [Tepidisphaera sp.]|nr:hypothetical protein [Tepidisphaera sp.]